LGRLVATHTLLCTALFASPRAWADAAIRIRRTLASNG
jgi:hypothetical protein